MPSRFRSRIIAGVAAACLLAAPAAGAERIDDFALLDHLGCHQQLTGQADVPFVVLYVYQVGCPIVRQDLPALTALAAAWTGRARILLLDPVPEDDRAQVVRELAEFPCAFPVLLDRTQVVGRGLGAVRTGEALVIRTADWSLQWRGPVDDRLGYGAQKPAATRAWLQEALTAAAAGSPAPAGTPAARGCAIAYATPEPPSYVADVAPILAESCVACHRAGGIGPFAMTGYERVKAHGAMIREVVRTRRMPPWGADPAIGSFAHDGGLDARKAATLVSWVEQGCPRGTGDDPLADLAPAPEWALGKPDLVIECPPQRIPATGVIPYLGAEIATTLPADAWVTAYQVLPSDARAMHHALAFVVEPGSAFALQDPRFSGLDEFLADYVPGVGAVRFPAGTGKRLPAGSRIGFQLHYTTYGKATTDRPRLGLYLAREKPGRELKTVSARNQRIAIPPGARDHAVEAAWRPKVPITLYGLTPHMHYRGSRMAFTALVPGSAPEPLLSVPRYDFNWQSMYWLAAPKDLPAGCTIACAGAFDNSALNEANPDPTATVRWGPQSWQEMFVGFILYSERP